MNMFKKLLYNYRMRKLRKYYVNYMMKHATDKYNAFTAGNGKLDMNAIKYVENLCDYIVRGVHR